MTTPDVPRDAAPLTEDEIRDARTLLGAITPGPWRVYRCRWAGDAACGIKSEPFVSENEDSYQRGVVYDTNREECHHAMSLVDATFIAAARTLVPRLLAERRALTKAASHALSSLTDIASGLRRRGADRDRGVAQLALESIETEIRNITAILGGS